MASPALLQKMMGTHTRSSPWPPKQPTLKHVRRAPAAPPVLSGYRVVLVLGSGGFSEVYCRRPIPIIVTNFTAGITDAGHSYLAMEYCSRSNENRIFPEEAQSRR